MRRLNVSTLAIAIALAAAGTAAGQPPKKLQLPAPTLDFIGPEIPLGPIVRGAPFSADASTSVTQLLGDGTRINRTVTATDAFGASRRFSAWPPWTRRTSRSGSSRFSIRSLA